MKRLEHKRCLVTGAARGIGEAIAARFLREGAQVILADIDFDAAAETARRLEHAALEDWQRVHRTNTDGTFLGCRYAIRAIRKAGAGSIINISSGAAAYAASKAAIRNHSKTVALYCAQQGLNIRCNSIHPAAILTPMWEPMLGDGPDREARMASFVADTPMKRFGTADEVAAIALLLASDEAAYMTGAELTVDGGLLAGSAAPPGRN